MRSRRFSLARTAATSTSLSRSLIRILLVALAVAAAATGQATARTSATAAGATAALPPGNTVAQWNKIAEDTVVGSGAFQAEGFIYMAYVSAAVYDSVVAIEGGFEPYGADVIVPDGASVHAAVIEAAYQTLVNYFPAQAEGLEMLHAEALGLIADGPAKMHGRIVGRAAAKNIIKLRRDDGRAAPIGVTSSFPTLAPGPGVWRLTPPFAAPQTPWVANVRPFLLESLGQFLPSPPPPLQSGDWVAAFDEIKAYGAATSSVRSAEQTAVARFWSANVVRQYNRVGRDLTGAESSLVQAARLMAMVNLVGADALMSALHAKYHYLFWRPVTAIDPTAVTADGFGPVPGYDDENTATVEQAGWRPLLTTPNHPEYPAAHGVITSAMVGVFSSFLGTNDLDLDVHGFDPAGPAGNLNAVRHFDTAGDLRQEIIDARIWAGLHYRFSGIAGVIVGGNVATYDLGDAFRPVD
jgi:VCPO second helical-bundle domain